MGLVRFLFSRSIPAYFWLGIGYACFVAFIYFTGDPEAILPAELLQELMVKDNVASVGDITSPTLNLMVDAMLNKTLLPLPLVSGAVFSITGTTIFMTLGFFCSWIEVVRATQIRNTARNDTWSLIMTLIAFVLFISVAPFGTTAFLIVALVGFGDVLLDRIVGQAVARRDFGGVAGFGGGGE